VPRRKLKTGVASTCSAPSGGHDGAYDANATSWLEDDDLNAYGTELESLIEALGLGEDR
jgi:hypothetical protein